MCPDKTWSKYEKHCYHLLTDKNNMSSCRQECVQLGGDLASIHSLEENKFISNLISKRPPRHGLGKGNTGKNTWIGGKYSQGQEKFIWFDQSEWDFVNWSSGYPGIDYNEEKWSCVFLGYDLQNLDKWYNGMCDWDDNTFDCFCKI